MRISSYLKMKRTHTIHRHLKTQSLKQLETRLTNTYKLQRRMSEFYKPRNDKKVAWFYDMGIKKIGI